MAQPKGISPATSLTFGPGEQTGPEVFVIASDTDPGSPGPGKVWVDTSQSPPLLYVRDAGNDNWLAVGAVPGGSPIPAVAVVGPDAFGDPAAVGVGLDYARGDHDHGLPAAPTPPSGIGAFPTLVQQSNFASANAAAPTIVLGAVPVAGDVIIVAAGNVQFPVDNIAGAGAVWTRLRNKYLFTGAFVVCELWMGVVGGAPNDTITITYTAANTYYKAAAVFRDPDFHGFVEWTEEDTTGSNLGIASTVATSLPPRLPTQSPICLAFLFDRGQGGAVTLNGFTDITTMSAGGDRAVFAMLDTSDGVTQAYVVAAGESLNQQRGAVAALIH